MFLTWYFLSAFSLEISFSRLDWDTTTIFSFRMGSFFFICHHCKANIKKETAYLRKEKALLKKKLWHRCSCEFCEISNNAFSYRTPAVAASAIKEKLIKNTLQLPALKDYFDLSVLQKVIKVTIYQKLVSVKHKTKLWFKSCFLLHWQISKNWAEVRFGNLATNYFTKLQRRATY